MEIVDLGFLQDGPFLFSIISCFMTIIFCWRFLGYEILGTWDLDLINLGFWKEKGGIRVFV